MCFSKSNFRNQPIPADHLPLAQANVLVLSKTHIHLMRLLGTRAMG